MSSEIKPETNPEPTFFEASEQYLIIIASCTGTKLKSVLEPFLGAVIDKFPQANFFPNRADGSKDKPGTIRVVGGGTQRQLIICFSQYYAGKNNLPSDSRSARVVWFKKCLDKIVKRPEVESLAFPMDIARDGGGDWQEYQQVIQDLTDYIKLERPRLRIKIYPTEIKPLITESVVEKELGDTNTEVPRMIGLRGVQKTVYLLDTMFMLDTSQRQTKISQPTKQSSPAAKQISPVAKQSSSTAKQASTKVLMAKPKITMKKPTVVMTSDQIMSDSDGETETPKSNNKITPVIAEDPETETVEGSPETETVEGSPEIESVEGSPETISGEIEFDDTTEAVESNETVVESNEKITLVSIVTEATPNPKSYDSNPNWQGLSSLPIEVSWQKLFQDRLLQSELKKLEGFFDTELAGFGDFYAILPQPPQNIFRAFQRSLNRIRVVILGQDPYHANLDEAMGLSFSVPAGVTIPPSLRNIFKELKTDIPGYVEPTSGDLSHWADQGVLLLNTSLTVRQNKPGSHLEPWQKFTERVIQLLAQDTKQPKVFLLWGKPAQKKAELIAKHNQILQAAHPSPLSANRGWFGSGHFSKTNQMLKDWGLNPIQW